MQLVVVPEKYWLVEFKVSGANCFTAEVAIQRFTLCNCKQTIVKIRNSRTYWSGIT